MKTTLTQKIDNYLEKTSGMITILSLIGAIIGSLFALGMSSDYGITTPTSFGVVFFLVFFGSVLGALGAYIVAEKIGYANSAQVSRSLHKHYNTELDKVRAEIESITNGYRALNTENTQSALLIHSLRETNTELGKRIATGTTELTRAYSTVSELQNSKRDLVASLERATLNENGLLNLVRVLTCASVTARALNRTDYTSPDYQEMLAIMGNALDEMRGLVVLDGSLTNDRLAWYAEAFHNGEGVGISDMKQLDYLMERVGYIENGGDYVEPILTYTHSATDALEYGTLDKAYTISNQYARQTVYPVK
jgi:hypothetical protein